MRQRVKDFNVYRWAGLMLLDAARLRRRQRTSEKFIYTVIRDVDQHYERTIYTIGPSDIKRICAR